MGGAAPSTETHDPLSHAWRVWSVCLFGNVPHAVPTATVSGTGMTADGRVDEGLLRFAVECLAKSREYSVFTAPAVVFDNRNGNRWYQRVPDEFTAASDTKANREHLFVGHFRDDEGNCGVQILSRSSVGPSRGMMSFHLRLPHTAQPPSIPLWSGQPSLHGHARGRPPGAAVRHRGSRSPSHARRSGTVPGGPTVHSTPPRTC